MKAHKNNTTDFKDLTNPDKARSITAMTNNLFNAIKNVVDNSEDPQKTKTLYVDKVKRFLERVIKI